VQVNKVFKLKVVVRKKHPIRGITSGDGICFFRKEERVRGDPGVENKNVRSPGEVRRAGKKKMGRKLQRGSTFCGRIEGRPKETSQRPPPSRREKVEERSNTTLLQTGGVPEIGAQGTPYPGVFLLGGGVGEKKRGWGVGNFEND